MEGYEHGLTSHEAEKLLGQYGQNQLESKKQKTWFLIFTSQYKSVLVLLLAIAAGVSFFLRDIIDGIFILFVVVLNSILGFIQEYKAERSLEKLKEHTRIIVPVMRDGRLKQLDSSLLVPGDILRLEAGNTVPADCILLEAVHCEVDESVLTGESAPVWKHPDNKKAHTLFMGTSITHGRCVARVIATGMHTNFGQIARELVDIKEDETPLAKAVTVIGKQLTILALVGSCFIILISLLYHRNLLDAVFTAISLAVAVVPEGLPVIITIALATGVSRLVKKNATIRKLAAMETLGSVTTIATDKTGTLTKNEMAVKKIWLSDAITPVDKISNITDKKAFLLLCEIAVLCNSAELVYQEGNTIPDVIGDKTEGALLTLSNMAGIEKANLKKQRYIYDEFSFDEVTRSMSMVVEKEGKILGLVKGAPEMLLAKSTKIFREGKVISLSEHEREHIISMYTSFASEGLRIIAFAYSNISPKIKKYNRSEVESEMVFVGFAGIADPPRSEVKEAIDLTRKAGITTVMITGDNEITARQIGVEITLIKKGEDMIVGSQIDEMTDEALDQVVAKTRIFARCTPHHKVRIVDSFKRRGEIVAVTGDGINDVLALQRADVGVAMGKGGTDVARSAADMVLTDDNYVTIVSAIEEGRVIFDNLVKSVSYLIAGNLSEIIVIMVAICIGLPSPFIPIQILWMNIVTDGLPALALAMDEKHAHVMSRPPRTVRNTIFERQQLFIIALNACAISALTLAVYSYGLSVVSLPLARAGAFTVMIILQMLLAFVVRGRRKITTNLFLIITVGITLILQILILIVPFLQKVFGIQV